MLLQLTIVDAATGDERPIEVRAEEHHTLDDLLTVLGRPTDTVTRIGGLPASPELRVGRPPLLDGAALVLGTAGRVTPPPTAPLRLVSVAGPDSGREVLLTHGRHVVGRGGEASAVLEDDTLSREHVRLTVDRDGVLVEDLATTNGTTLGADPLPQAGARMRVGDCLRAGRTTFVLGRTTTLPSRRRPTGRGTLAVSPVPHVPDPLAMPTLTLPEEPRPPRRRPIPWVMVLAPLPIAAVMALVLGPRMLLLCLMTPVLVLASTVTDRTGSRREHRAAHAQWRLDSREAAHRLELALAVERRARLRAAPDAVALLDAARGDGPRLWQRHRDHEEHLDLRIGLGDAPSRTTVRHGSGEREHPVVSRVPIVLDLSATGVLGIAGPRPVRDRLARHLLSQLVVLHSPRVLRLAVVAGEGGWPAPFAGLVHLREHEDVPGSARAAVQPGDVGALLAALAANAREASESEQRPAQDTVVVVDEVDRWRTDGNLRTLLDAAGGDGPRLIALADSPDQLPHEAGAVVLLEGHTATVRVAGEGAARCTVDGVGAGWAHRLVDALLPLRDATPSAAGGALPTSTRLLDLIGVDPDDVGAVRRQWSSRPRAPVDLAVPVGAGGDEVVGIDLRRDGPHALVAGTTGAGKSEFLQTWVASLALHLTPEEISFVLVDYKGGAAFADCTDLPHTVGVLTDLDETQTRRALTSLDAELTRREHLLAASGAADVDAHEGPPLPRLMIVVDEFRVLAEEQPEALGHLMRIATVGRSLGVHLVLATQRPGGIVSADIRANVNLRIALRVRDRADSEDVIGSRDAVTLPEDAPGRALARTGGGPARAFQTGRVAGRAGSREQGLRVRDVGRPWPPAPDPADAGPSDLHRLAVTLTKAAAELGTATPHRPWLPPLPHVLAHGDIPGHAADEGGAPFGIRDRPAEQRQVPLRWSPAEGSWMVIGGPGTGRTTTLAAVVGAAAGAFPPERVHVQVLGDGSAGLARLAGLPHVGSIIDGSDPPVLRRFLDRLEEEVRLRRGAAREAGHPTLEAWWEAWEQGTTASPPPPHLLVAVDGWGRLRPTGTVDPVEPTDRLEAVAREGTAVGVRLLLTGGRELLGGRIGSLVPNRLVLHLADRGDAALVGLTRDDLTGPPIPGRGRVMPGGDLVQVALPDPVDPPAAVPASTAPSEEGGSANLPWTVTPLPERVAAGALAPPSPGRIPVGVGGCGGETLCWQTSRQRRLLVCGPPGSGRSSALAVLAQGLGGVGVPVALVTEDHPAAGTAGLHVLAPHDREQLLELRRGHPELAVLVDDLDRLEDAPVSDVLREVVRRVDADRGVVVGSSSPLAATSVRGLVAEVARGRSGLLLQPSNRSDGDPFGMRLPPLPRFPGRGHLVLGGSAREVQVALPVAPGGRAA
ncbi:FtsK/SpoIIIE domain-containing protein [Janibacter corallicola]|uniref:FtsK/SpoIIIE domain-containing protein n=1 Tax=Janibacter corallicola TaxID=415212 RepID=UPI000ACD3525|nr:FtsK/SpoIIIE domain-containing protein [Janibacter corallicola]